MQLTLIGEHRLTKFSLPEKVGGQHWIRQEANGKDDVLVPVHAADGEWKVCSDSNIIFDDDTDGRGVVLAENTCYPFVYRNTEKTSENDRKFILFAEPSGGSSSVFCRYELPASGKIRIGSEEGDDIRFSRHTEDTPSLERVPANAVCLSKLSESSEAFWMETNTFAPVYLNGRRMEAGIFCPGDELWLWGLRVLLGPGFLSVNYAEVPEQACGWSLELRLNRWIPSASCAVPTPPEDTVFSSAPRYPEQLRTAVIPVEAPPKPEERQETPWILMMGPSITMAFGSVFSSVFTVRNILNSNGDILSVLPTLVMSLCMMFGMILWPFFAKRHERRARECRSRETLNRYYAELEHVSHEIYSEINRQSAILRSNHPTLETCLMRIETPLMELWERSPKHADFLELMVGQGTIPADIRLDVPLQSGTEKETEAKKALERLLMQERLLKNVPVTLSLRKNPIVGFFGNRTRMTSIVRALLLELTALHDSSDVRLICICDKKKNDWWNLVRWMPHLWNDDRTFRFFVSSPEEARRFSGVFSEILAQREQVCGDEVPHYVILSADKTLTEKIHPLQVFLQNPNRYSHISMLSLVDTRMELPKNCSAVCDVREREVLITGGGYGNNPQVVDVPVEWSWKKDPEEVFAHMARIEQGIRQKDQMLPASVPLLDLYEAGKAEHIDIRSMWGNSDPVRSLAVVIGVDADGTPIVLDLHEKAHGPHGLIAGMTGSGKSEFIISYIISMAIGYSPEEVAFVLIDFKGGGMADTFRNLPHLAGSITNLEGNEIQRSFLAIESELEKRQNLFKKVGETKKISNIDIYKYQKLRRSDPTMKPLPHLILICDEFAELKQQHNDFMDQLIRIARIGRSLGVHLILATQRPDGIVNEQIKSNIRFKVCLKVQSKADSQSVLDCGDAARITREGRFYLQVGSNEVFTYGQAPWAGAPYVPEEHFIRNTEKKLEVVDRQGQVIYSAAVSRRKNFPSTDTKQVDALVQYLHRTAEEQNCRAEKLWLEPMKGPAPQYSADEDETAKTEAFVLNPVIGMYDDLQRREHRVLTLPMTAGGSTVVYGAGGSGKLSFLNQVFVSLMENHSPEEVRIFAADCDAGSLSAFENAPHVERIVLGGEPSEAEELLKVLRNELDQRKTKFRRFGGEYQTYVRTSGETLPNLILAINNAQAFFESVNGSENVVTKLACEGKKYGIFVILTALSPLRYTMRPMFRNVYVLQQDVTTSYAELLGKTGGIIPGDFKGRGIFKKNGVTYEFQTTIAFEHMPNIYEAITGFCDEMTVRWGERRKTKRLPAVLTREYLEQLGCSFTDVDFTVGVEENTGKPLSLELNTKKLVLIAYDREEEETADAVLNEIRTLNEVRWILDPENSLKSGDSRCRTDGAGIEDAILELNALMEERGNAAMAALDAGEPVPVFPNVLMVIRKFTGLAGRISPYKLQMLSAIIQQVGGVFNLRFVVSECSADFRAAERPELLGQVLPAKRGLILGNDTGGQKFFGLNEKFNKNFSEVCEKAQGRIVKDNVTRSGRVISSK